MTEQPSSDAVDADRQEASAEQPPGMHDHVRTDGETNVDDAIGATDDPL